MDLYDMIIRLRRRVLPQRRRRTPVIWIRQWLRRREDRGQYHYLVAQLYHEDQPAFTNFMLMSPKILPEIERRLTPDLQKQTTFLLEPLRPDLKLAITLRHLATGESYVSLQFAFRMGRSTINRFVPEVCDAIIRYYHDDVVTCPICPENWLEIEQGFRERWNLPHVLGAIDRKYPHQMSQAITSTTRASIPLSCWLWWMQTISLSGLTLLPWINLFIYLGFYVTLNTVQVISRRRVVGRAEETSTYSSSGIFTVNCRPMASNYQLSHLRP